MGSLPEGCKYCLRGEKLVLFIGGKCSRSCWYCSLSNCRKNTDYSIANERIIKQDLDLIKEVEESNSKGSGITGGDPLLYYTKVLKYAKLLKEKFGEKFHIHIYLPPKLVTKQKIKSLEPYIDEFRFHPNFLLEQDDDEMSKIILTSEICGREKVGLELPMIPEKSKEIFEYVSKIKNNISFVNLNEFEISETNFDIITKKYILNEDTYTIRNSITEGKKLLRKIRKLRLRAHLCTARTKNFYQYINRLKNHKIANYGKKTKDGNVIYFVVYSKNFEEDLGLISKYTNKYIPDKKKSRIILSRVVLKKIHKNTNLKIEKILEPPVFDADYLERDVVYD